MRKLFKNFNILGLIAFIAAGIMAISWTEMKQKEEAKWYPVELTEGGNSNNLEDYEIGTTPISEPTGDCSTIGEILCAVQLEVSSSTFPANMAEAEANPDVEIVETRHRD